MKAAIYPRVSTLDQEPENQLQEMIPASPYGTRVRPPWSAQAVREHWRGCSRGGSGFRGTP